MSGPPGEPDRVGRGAFGARRLGAARAVGGSGLLLL